MLAFVSRVQVTLIGTLGLVLAASILSGVSGCGYHFQKREDPIFQAEKIQKLFISPLQNDSFKPGIENLMYSALVRTFSAKQRLELVDSEKTADLVLTGSVSGASYGVTGAQPGDRVFPSGTAMASGFAGGNYQTIAQTYEASMSANFSVNRVSGGPKKVGSFWAGGFSRRKSFAASNQLGTFGTTSALINESEFDRALGDLVDLVAQDTHESLFFRF